MDGLASGVTFVALLMPWFALWFQTTSLVFCGALAELVLVSYFQPLPCPGIYGRYRFYGFRGAIGAVAAISRSEIALLIIGGIYVIEALSVIIQVVSFQTTGKRVFLMSPLHHHFELKGWSEVKIVRVFSILSFLFAIVGLLGFKGIGIR